MKNLKKLFNHYFNVGFDSKGIKSIKNPKDPNDMDFILQNDNNYINYEKVFKALGHFDLVYDKNDQSKKCLLYRR